MTNEQITKAVNEVWAGHLAVMDAMRAGKSFDEAFFGVIKNEDDDLEDLTISVRPLLPQHDREGAFA